MTLDTEWFWRFVETTQEEELLKLQKTGGDWQIKVLLIRNCPGQTPVHLVLRLFFRDECWSIYYCAPPTAHAGPSRNIITELFRRLIKRHGRGDTPL